MILWIGLRLLFDREARKGSSMAASGSNEWPWQQQQGMPPALPKKPPPPRDEGELYGSNAQSTGVPATLQRSLGYGADIKVPVKARPKEGSGNLPWSDAMQVRAQGSAGGIPAPKAAQPALKAFP